MRKVYYIFGTMLILASLAYGQADSCNMSLVDEWTAYTPGRFGNLGLDIAGDHVIAAVGTQVYVLNIDSTGALTFMDSLNKEYEEIVVKDTLCFFVHGFNTDGHPYDHDSTHIMIYSIDDSGELDSLGFFSLNGWYRTPFIEDTLFYCFEPSVSSGIYTIFNVSDALSATHIVSGYGPGMGSGGIFTAQYPLIFSGGYSTRGEYPWTDYTQGRINVLNASDPDSIYVANQFWTQTGSREHDTSVRGLAVYDTILYAYGPGLEIETYSFSEDGSTSFLSSFTDTVFFMSTFADFGILEDIMYTCGKYFVVYNLGITEPMEVLGYYKRGALGHTFDVRYLDACRIDSFVVSLGTQTGTDTVRISVMKLPSYGSSGNCELFQCPKNLELDIFPNPFNSALQINASDNATITIHDTQGRMVADLGTSRIWNAGDDMASGVYIVRAVEGDEEMTGKVVLIR